MPLSLKVQTELDDRSMKDTADKAQSLFEGLGSTSGEVFTTSLQSAIGRSGDIFANISTAVEQMGAGIESSALVGAAGIAGIGFAAVKLTEELYSVGARFDSIFDNLAVRTGKAGDDLAVLEDTVRRVGDTTAASFEKIGDVAGQLSQAFDLSGPGLDDLTHRIATLDRLVGQDLNIREFGQLLRGFDIDAADAAQTINELLSASQRSIIPINELVSSLQSAGPAARILGLSMEETANLMLAFEKSGLDASNTTMALSHAATTFSEHNIDLKTGLDDTITQMKAFIDANNESAAVTLAKDVFGARAARNFVDAVKDGTLTVKSLHDGLGPVGDKLTELDNQTRDWSENWAMLKNNVTDLANEFGGPLFDGINKALGALNDFLAGLKEPPPPLPGAPGDSSPQALGDLLGVPAPSGPLPGQPGFIGPVDTGALPPGGNVGDVLPPLILSNRPPGAPPQDIAGALADKPAGGGAGLGPQVPYPAEYTAGPLPGETSQQYSARMSRIESDHKIAQANADLEAVRNDEKHTAEQLQQAENNLAKATQDRQQLELRLSEQKPKTPGFDVAIPYAPGFGAGPEPGETTSQYSARTALMEAQHKAAEEYAKLRQMEASGVATQNDIINQKNKVLEAQRAQQAAEMRLNDVYTKQVTDATKGLDALGAGLDKDLGLSKGLAGLADNLVRFLGSLAAAPLMGQINAITAAQGGVGATGSGLIAMAGAMGAFGPDYQVGGYDTTGKPYSMAALQGAGGAGGAAGGGRLTIGQVDQLAAQFGLTKTSGYRNEPGSFHATGLAGDYAGSPEQMDAFANFMALNYGDQLNELIHSGGGTQYNVYRGQLGPVIDQPGSVYNSGQAGYHGDHDHIAVGYGGGNMQGFAPGGRRSGNGPSGIANMIYSMARQRGYSDHDAQSIVAYAIGESSLNPMAGGGVQGGSGDPYADNVIGLFQQKPDFARAGGIDPSLRGDPYYNTLAYLNNLDRNRGMPIEQALPRTSVGGPLAPGGYQPWGPLMNRAGQLIDPNAINYGGQPQTYDTGGPLPPGITVVQNNTGQNEHVFRTDQIGSQAKAAAQPAAIMGPNIAGGPGGGGPAPGPAIGQQGPTQIGGEEPKAQSGASAGAGGGLFGAGIGAAAAAADMWAPGSGAAVQIAGQEIQRAIKAGGQFAGIVAGGLMETFLPTGASQIANDNWVTRIGGAFAGMAPQLPNLAGKPPTPIPNKVDAQSPMPLFGDTGTPKQPGGGSPTFNLTLNSNGPIEDRHIDQLTNSLNRQYETGMAQVGGR